MKELLSLHGKDKSLVIFAYKNICKVYQLVSTTFEEIFLRKKEPKKKFFQTGIFDIKNFNNVYLEKIETIKAIPANKYLSIRMINFDQIDNLVNQLFDKKLRNQITQITGFAYSIDFMIFYDRKFIPHPERKVPTLKQSYSYRWHFDKPNSKNMLKVFVPINISYNHGPLEVIDIKNSKKIKYPQKINLQQERTYFTGSKNIVYGFKPTTCLHKDGIPEETKIATQIMFQLNPNKKWVINSNLYSRNSSLNDKLGIWTTEPKFPFFSYLFDRRLSFKD